MKDSVFDLLCKKYYPIILRYCRVRLNGDLEGAKDCTQEVFLVLYQKLKQLTELESILPWLYRTADREIKTYIRKHPPTEELDEYAELPVPEPPESILDTLPEEERNILEQYYSGMEKQKLAEQYGLSTTALYQKLYRIREKIRDVLDSSHK